MDTRHGDTVYVGAKQHKAARQMKVVVADDGSTWLCDAGVDESKALKEQGCWRCGDLVFTRDESMDLPEELEFERLSFEEKYHRAVPGYMKRLANIYGAVYERFGEEGLELIQEVSRDLGTRIGNNVKKKGDLNGVMQVGRYLLKIFDMVSQDWQVQEHTKDRLVITVSRCPYGFAHDGICRAHTSMEQALVGVLDGTLEYRIGRSIPQGDPVCEHILTSKLASN